MYYIYILYPASSDIYCVGFTNDHVRRLYEHNHQESFNTFTSKHRLWVLKAAFECGDSEKEAVQIELHQETKKPKLYRKAAQY
jgi:putative endonuclease